MAKAAEVDETPSKGKTAPINDGDKMTTTEWLASVLRQSRTKSKRRDALAKRTLKDLESGTSGRARVALTLSRIMEGDSSVNPRDKVKAAEVLARLLRLT